MKTLDNSTRFDREILPRVRKPHRYAGHERNRIVKPDAELRWALAFPDLYEIGMSHLGVQLLYHRINTMLPRVAAERVFLPEEDMARALREARMPLSTLESRTPLKDVDLLGISLSYEMAMPGLLELLDLGGLPLRSEQRGEGDPIVLAGGPVAFNPEPFADFVELVVLGDGEEVVVEIGELALRAKRAGWPRARLLDELAAIEGVYRPAAQKLKQTPAGLLVADLGGERGPVATGRTLAELRPEYYPDKPLVPLAEVAFDRVQLEVMRGCTRGCRFCQAGILYRPVRERRVEDVLAQAVANVAATGHSEISISSLSTSDYNGLPELITGLRDTFAGRGVSLAFPSLRPDSFTREMARALPGQRKGTLTFAPEAGSQRMRDVINKNSYEHDLLGAAKIGFEEGYNHIKLYFMIGLPGETMEDITAIATLAGRVAALRTRGGQRVTASVSPFAPKAHTPFARHRQDTVQRYREKISLLRSAFAGHPARLTTHDPRSAVIEAALARGDRRAGAAVEKVWRAGGFLEAWSDRFDPNRWETAFAEAGIPLESYVAATSGGGAMPWDHVSKGVSDAYFAKEAERAERAQLMPDCREGRCDACGLARFIPSGQIVCNVRLDEALAPVQTSEQAQTPPRVVTVRMRYRRSGAMRWTGHLDLVRAFDRWMRRAQVPIAWSQGFHPHPRISFAPPLPLGLVSEDEYADLDLSRELAAAELLDRLAAEAPEGIELRELAVTESKLAALQSSVDCIEYSFALPDKGAAQVRDKIGQFLAADRVEIERERKGKRKRVDLRQFVGKMGPIGDTDRWRVELIVRDGATARLGELAELWGLDAPLGHEAARMAMFTGTSEDGQTPLKPMQLVPDVRSLAPEVATG